VRAVESEQYPDLTEAYNTIAPCQAAASVWFDSLGVLGWGFKSGGRGPKGSTDGGTYST